MQALYGKDSVIFDLKISPSGHLILPVDKYEDLPNDPEKGAKVMLYVRSDAAPSSIKCHVVKDCVEKPGNDADADEMQLD